MFNQDQIQEFKEAFNMVSEDNGKWSPLRKFLFKVSPENEDGIPI